MSKTTLVAGFDNETGRQVNILRLKEGEAMPADHMQPGRSYGFYREEAFYSCITGEVLLEAGTLMMAGAPAANGVEPTDIVPYDLAL